MLKFVVTCLVLGALAPVLSGCVFLVLGYFAAAPGPRTSIDVTWADQPALCAAAIAGRPGKMRFVGLESHHFAKVSNLSYTQRRYEVWNVPSAGASFVRLSSGDRAVFDFDNDGTVDLVYAGGDDFYVLPATAAMRNAFESRSASRSALVEQGLHTYHRSDWLKVLAPAVQVQLQRVENVTYVLATLPAVPFDSTRPSAPKFEPPFDGREPTGNDAAPATLYRMGPSGPQQKVCSFLEQTSAYAIGF